MLRPLMLGLLVSLVACCGAAQETPGKALPRRWFFSAHDIAAPAHKQALLSLIERAADHWFNGVVLQTGLFEFKIRDPATLNALRR